MKISMSSAENFPDVVGSIFGSGSRNPYKPLKKEDLKNYYMWTDYREELEKGFSYGTINEGTDKFGNTWLWHGFTGGAVAYCMSKTPEGHPCR